MFEVRGDTLYWQHYAIAELNPVPLGVRRQLEEALLEPDLCSVDYTRLKQELNEIDRQLDYLDALAKRLATRAGKLQNDTIPLEICVSEIDVLDQAENIQLTITRFENIVRRIENEIYEP